MNGSASEVRLIPREILFGNTDKTQTQLSPDGAYISYLAPVEGVQNIWIWPIGGHAREPVTYDRERGIRWYFWGYDSKHLLYLQDAGGNENWRLYSVNLEGKETIDLTPFENVQAHVIHTSKHHPDELIILLNKENEAAHDVYRLAISTGALTLIAENPGNILGWVVDADLQVRGACAAAPEGGIDLLVRDDERSDWRTIVSWDSEDALSSGPIGFAKDGGELYVIDSRNSNSGRLVRMNTRDGSYRVLAEDPQYDVGEVMIDPDTYEVQAVSYFRERKQWTVLAAEVEEDFAAIRNLHDGDFQLSSWDLENRMWLITFQSDKESSVYYTYDRQSRTGTFLFHADPVLAEFELAPMEPISFTSRDGLTIHGYITFPPRRREGVPMVLNVHGGPWGRDRWGFQSEHQWLANRGYACLSVNFRGSTGYGKAFLNAGNKEWAGAMHNDLVDAVEWAVRMGYANPDRVAIYGTSYGGYAALVGATFTPELFCCAVDVVGPSSLVTFIRSVPPYWAPMLAILHERVGNPDLEEAFLRSRSPLFKTDQIRIPLLIAQGGNDPRVKQSESEQIVDALRARGLDHEYLLFPDEGHGFVKPQNRLRFYEAAERFLARHLGDANEV
ncbi:S9 family peptidase [Paenibacillus rhizovicinus]|uniref:S9 family peptidase n=1 Tax=Paenibacillus rhizovicinus TaxID=2704463 RepID=A0A6C0NTJ4_9BACL|nr:S9 family peptidase [Paenibacillus rhizovicinus]QHW29539.1 S9 family peptidase [Paenibacillus rhizovicinus]